MPQPTTHLVGQRFGRLFVKERLPEKVGKAPNLRIVWLCICDCGVETKATTTILKSGNKQSCGCLRSEMLRAKVRQLNLIGHRYSRLRVEAEGEVRLVGRKQSPRRTWLCKCDCGNTLHVTTEALRSGNTSSCGCYVMDRITAPRSVNKRKLKSTLVEVRNRAAVRGWQWDLTDEQATTLFMRNCHYCDSAPRVYKTGAVRNGIDRMDNGIGYVLGNVVSCCPACNDAKGAMGYEDFLAHVAKIYAKMNQPA